MRLRTRQKIFLASLAYHPLARLRRSAGRPNPVVARRGGFRWELDLNEVVDFMIYLTGGFETYLTRFLRRNLRPGDAAIDIGANIGAHTLAMGAAVRPGGTALAIEATEFAFRKLRRNLALNPDTAEAVRARHALLGPAATDARAPDRGGARIPSSWPFVSGAPRNPDHQGVAAPVGDAERTTLDQLVAREALDRLDLVKMDVDGNEWDVLSGAGTTFDRFRPMILMELAPDYGRDSAQSGFRNIHAFFHSRGYRFFDFKGRPLEENVSRLAASIPPGASKNAVILDPRRHAAHFH